jgi:hypothetical protein
MKFVVKRACVCNDLRRNSRQRVFRAPFTTEPDGLRQLGQAAKAAAIYLSLEPRAIG